MPLALDAVLRGTVAHLVARDSRGVRREQWY